MIDKVEQLIREINLVHQRYSVDYFETGKVQKVNLKKTLDKVPVEHILRYRLVLHESINDYLFEAELSGVDYYYRVKTGESIHDKVERFASRSDKYAVNKWMNDIFGCRMILDSATMEKVEDLLDEWETKYGLKNWYKRDAEGYKGIHVYFKNESNFYFPWELQLWDEKHARGNIESHRKYKRNFIG